MLLVLIAVLFIVSIYYLFTYGGRRTAAQFSTMPKESKIGIVDITNDDDDDDDDDDLLTEDSSALDFTTIDDEGAEGRDKNESEVVESQPEFLEYTEMKIEEPPSFLNSQYDVAPRVKTGVNSEVAIPRIESNGDEEGEVFQKKRSKQPRVGKNGSVFFNCKEKNLAGKNGDQISANFDESPRVVDEARNESDSPAYVSAINSYEAGTSRGRKPLRHVTITLEDEEEASEVRKEVKHEELQIAGVNVKFPVKPYPSQIAVMNKLIQGCKKEEHCLLESPTGSGKTLALLCGVLAWQEHVKNELKQQNSEAAQKAREQFQMEHGIEAETAATYVPSAEEAQDDKPPCCKASHSNNSEEMSEDEESQPSLKKICRSTSPGSMRRQAGEQSNFESLLLDDVKLFMEETRRKKPPTIYYGSRTHKQIEQVVRELKKTAYAYKRMTILSSREFTCIQQTDNNKTEVCTKLLDPTKGLGCKFYNENTRNRISSNRALNRFGINGPWDIEDLVEIGREQSACPYFAARDLMLEADIVFCPYNYLVDPNIRQSMQINLDGQVVILDEAHNVEEMSRDVGSLSFREDKINEVLEEAELLSNKRRFDYDVYNTIKVYLQNFLQFIRVNNLNTVDRFNETSSSDFWTGGQLCELFNIHSLGKGIARTFKTAAAAAIMDFNTAKEEITKKQQSSNPSPVITPIAKKFLEDLVLALEMMASEKFANDYRACIIESNVRDFSKVTENTWVPRGATKRLRALQMLCMNPAVIFAPLAIMARSVILASGTLSPISSFQSELGTVFPHKLDANHVVPKESVYIRGIPCGPTGVALKANYANVNSWNFQDELGRLILNVCKVIPHGVLCFFSSYSMMQKQIDRWKQNSCWDQLEEVKYVLQEPRGSSNLEPVMQEFRDIIQSTSEGPCNGITGALLLAVFRGKVAEGIDFSDNEARCVMAIGIPYAIRKDPSVDMKFTYNNLNHSKGLLKGGEWYAVQAFRALNQALGRCVRHRNDWGAVLLIDQRFLERSSYNYLPKWVKTMWRDSPRYNLMQELEQFVASQVKRSEKQKSDAVSS